MIAAGAVGGILANLLVAASDGRSRKPVVVGGVHVTAIGLLVFAFAWNGASLLVASALVAAGATGFVHGGEITILGVVPDERLEHVLARANLSAVAGDVLGPVVLAAARVAGMGWRTVFVAAAVVTVAYGLLLHRMPFPPPRPKRAHQDVETGGGGSAMRRALVTVALVGVASLLIAPLDESFLAVVLAFAERNHGFSPAGAAVLGVAFVGGGVLSFTVLPRLVARVSTGRLLMICGPGLAAVTVGTALAPSWALALLGVAHSALLGACWLGVQALSLRAMPGREGRALLVVEIIDTFSLVLIVALGALADAAGLRAAILGFAAVSAALTLPAMAFSRRA